VLLWPALRVLLQVKESANCLLHVAKQMGCATFLVRGASHSWLQHLLAVM
jgi:hypothetical protein